MDDVSYNNGSKGRKNKKASINLQRRTSRKIHGIVTRAMSLANSNSRKSIASQMALKVELTLEDKLLSGRYQNSKERSLDIFELKKRKVEF